MRSDRLAAHILAQIETSVNTIIERTRTITCADDFLSTPQGVEKLDAVCMQLMAVGEAVKNLDKVTESTLLPRRPEIPWRDIMGLRDIIAHHYFDVDAEEIWHIVDCDLVPLRAAIVALRRSIAV